MDSPRAQNRSRSRFLLRGESAIASTGLFVAAIILFVMAGSAWWTARAQEEERANARRRTLESAGAVLAEYCGTLLANSEVSRARQIVAQVASLHDLDECRIVLPSGEVVADSEPSRITLAALPETWATASVNDSSVPLPSGDLQLSFPISVAGRGAARLDIAAPTGAAAWSITDTQAGIGVIGATALVALLIVYRRMRGRMQGLSYIRESLLAIDDGERSMSALTVREDLGPEAAAWNELLSERESLQQVLVIKRLLELPSANQERSHDLTSMCDAMPQGLILVDESLNVTYANGAASLYLGHAREEILGLSIETVVTDEQILGPVREVASGGLRHSTSVEIEQSGDDSQAVLRFGIRPVRRDDESAAMIVIEDVTQQRLASEARNTFVAQVTHELRAPLTNILLHVETAMEEDENDPQATAQCLNVINQEAKRLDRIVGDMLSVAEIEAGTHSVYRDDVSLQVLFDELRTDYEKAAEDLGLKLSFDLPPKLPVIQADRDKLSLAIHNLIGNALKYTGRGGQIAVEFDTDESIATVKVSDTGIGIRDEELERIFDKFYRARDERVADVTGSGLGLALAREVMRLQGGDITVESELDRGSTFVLTVPTLATAA